MKTLAMDVDDTISQDENLVTLKVYIPDLLIQKNFQFHKDEYIWDIKQYIFDSLPKELKGEFNYGIFCPPVNGRAGKFLDEHRPLADYPFQSSVGYVELRYKRRIYKMMNVEEKQIKQLHTRANLRRLLEHVNNGQIEKITKMCARGMDPNFHCPESGETPLTVSTSLKQPSKIIMALINGGALLDFRTRDGMTALHKAVERNNLEALKTLLDLGASPNYKDGKGLTPLYYTVLHGSDHQLTETLLHDHAFIGTCDPQGWQEVHHACKHGLVQHLENLLFYGADMNAQNASGNTPLHVCAVNDQESCARVLLFRGADKNSLNFANQNPYQVAVIAGNLNLGDLIRNHNSEDVVPYREMPRYNPRRRASIAPVSNLCRTHSDPRLDLHLGMKPPSPCPSNCSLPPFSSISCISDTSTGSSTCTHPSVDDSEDTASDSIVTEKSVTSDSSGVCTSNSAGSYDSCHEHHRTCDIYSKRLFHCITDYNSKISDHLQLVKGDIIEVIREAEDGFLLGRTESGQTGFFPNSCTQEINTRNIRALSSSGYQRVEGRREKCSKCISSVTKKWKIYGEPRTVILHKGKKGFGFVLRGTKASSPLMERESNDSCPSQYLEDVNKGGVADLAGLKKGDYLLEINGQDVSQASHEHVVSIIQQSGNLVAMTVITLNNPSVGSGADNIPFPYRQCATLPRKLVGKKAPVPPKRDPKTTLSVGRIRARSMVAGLAEIESLEHTLNEYDSEGRSTKSSSVESIPNKTGMKSSNSQLTKTASIKARPSSQRVSAAELEQFFERQGSKKYLQSYTLSERSRKTNRPHKVYGSVAEMKRSKASRSKLAEAALKIHKEFFSTPDLKGDNISNIVVNRNSNKKRSLSQEDVLHLQRSRHSWASAPNDYNSYLGLCDDDYTLNYNDAWKSIEDVYDSSGPVDVKEGHSDIYSQTLPLRKDKNLRASCPPPPYPPPPPPVGQLIKVDVSKTLGDYANVNQSEEDQNSQIMSSFRPGDSAKLYASPEIVMSVGYKPDGSKEALQPRRIGGGSSLRSQSLPPKICINKSDRGSATSSEAENSGDSGGLYSTFKKTSRQRDSMSTDSGHVSDRGTFRPVKAKATMSSAFSSSKFDEDSDASSPHNYPTVRTPCHEPFIPEPDYESSEDDFLPISVDKGGSLSTFGKGDLENDEEKPLEEATISVDEEKQPDDSSFSPHTEAKRAIQEARERLRFSQKPIDKNATVVFISGKITEHKVEKSEIQLHRTEEGRLTGTVVISTTNEPQESLYLSSSILKGIDNEKPAAIRYPSRDAPASEYAKYRQQILSGANQTAFTDVEEQSSTDSPQENVLVDKEEYSKQTEVASNVNEDKPIDGLKITLTGTQKCPLMTKDNTPVKKLIERQFLLTKENAAENVNKVSEKQHLNEQTDIPSPDTENKAETILQLSESGQIYKCQNVNQRKKENNSETNTETVYDVKPTVCPQNAVSIKNTSNSINVSSSSESQGIQNNVLQHKIRTMQDKTQTSKLTSDVIKTAQQKDKYSYVSKERKYADNRQKSTEKSLEESLEVLRMQVNSLGFGAINDVDVFTDLVPPPPEFAAAEVASSKKDSYSSSEIAIEPPPEFSDNTIRYRSKSGCHRTSSNIHQRKNISSSHHINTSSKAVDLNFLTSLSKSNIMQIIRTDKKSCLGGSSGGINVHLPCTSGLRHLPSHNISDHLIHETYSNEPPHLKSVQKEFRFKLLQEWTANDIADWLDSLFLPEYKQRFSEAGITGAKLANMDSNDLMGLGVKQMGHRLNMERSLKRYLK